ncbi:MAG: hypothetical protein KGS45_00660 [Planctomycetes bacterium]|nr:hypothetical protein [Planctomycetota bacterium]
MNGCREGFSFGGIVLSVMVCWGGLSGCQSGHRESCKKIDSALFAGDVNGAATIAYAEYQNKANERDRVVRALDAGSLLLLTGRHKESSEALTSAYEVVRPYLDSKAEDSVAEGVATTVVNQTLADYKSTPVERVMLNTFLSIGQMIDGNSAGARIELNRANDWQQDARNRYAASIENDRNAALKSAGENGVDMQKAIQTPGLSRLTEGLENIGIQSPYQSAWTSYLRGVFLASAASDAGDISTARSELRLAWESCPDARSVIEIDLAAVDRGKITKTTWVFAFSGLCPRREELRLDIPIPVGNVNYVSAAFPLLKSVDAHTSQFVVSSAEGSVNAQMLMNVEDVVKAEYKQQLPTIIAQEILSSALKAAATYGAKSASNDNTTSLILQISGIIYQAATTSADLRGWRTLPKHIYVARIQTPDNGKLTVSVPGGPAVQVSVDPLANNGVIIWHTQPGTQSLANVAWRMQ